jgi:hypothetical protein
MHCFVSSSLVYSFCVFLHCIPSVHPPPFRPLRMLALINLTVIHCVVFGFFVFAKSSGSKQDKSASKPRKSESNKGIM